ncbi:MAG TPA: DUF167 domain-containing protein [Actinomycetota bacterium]
MLHPVMAMVTVHVVPGSRDTRVEVGEDGVVVRVRAAPEAGKATDEARRALASALRVAPSRVRLRVGARSRTKAFEVDGLSQAEVEVRLSAT